MSEPRLLLDEMFSDAVAHQLREKGYDALSVVADPALVGLPDEEILAQAAQSRRTLVTANIKDFMPLALINLLAAAGQVAPDHVVFLTRS
jgi:hypothetical protein